jgi:hypothetical protein
MPEGSTKEAGELWRLDAAEMSEAQLLLPTPIEPRP